MSYVDSNVPAYSSRTLRRVICEDFSGGVRQSEKSFSDGALCQMSNFCSDGKYLFSRPVLNKLSSSVGISGDFHSFSKTPFNEKTIIHAGEGLYSIDDEGVTLLLSGLPDKNSFNVEMNSKLYFYSDLRVYEVDNTFTAREVFADAPLINVNILAGSPALDSTKISDVKLNLISPRVSASYKISNLRSCFFPVECDFTKKIVVTNKGEVLPEDRYTVNDRYVLLDSDIKPENDGDIVVSFYAKNYEDIGFVDVFSKLKVAACYGGSVISGTRILASGNPEEKGKCYISELLNPLAFYEDSFEVLGNGSEDICGFCRQYGNLLVFTEKSVLSMSYGFKDDTAVFTVRELNSTIGCDIPKSIQMIDNRVVFASSKKGFFIIDSTENFDERNIKPISENINESFLELTSEQLSSACSYDFDRKYYFCAGNKVFVWDYGKKAYIDSGNYASAQKKLVWYLYDVPDIQCLFESSRKLFAYSALEGISFFGDGDGDFGTRLNCSLRFGETDFSDNGTFKNVCCVHFECDTDADVYITAFADGKQYYKTKLDTSAFLGDRRILSARLPYLRLMRFDFSLQLEGKNTLYGITIDYKQVK